MRPYGRKKGGKPATKSLDCCPGHTTDYVVQSKHSHKVGGRAAGRRVSKRRERLSAKLEIQMQREDGS